MGYLVTVDKYCDNFQSFDTTSRVAGHSCTADCYIRVYLLTLC